MVFNGDLCTSHLSRQTRFNSDSCKLQHNTSYIHYTTVYTILCLYAGSIASCSLLYTSTWLHGHKSWKRDSSDQATRSQSLNVRCRCSLAQVRDIIWYWSVNKNTCIGTLNFSFVGRNTYLCTKNKSFKLENEEMIFKINIFIRIYVYSFLLNSWLSFYQGGSSEKRKKERNDYTPNQIDSRSVFVPHVYVVKEIKVRLNNNSPVEKSKTKKKLLWLFPSYVHSKSEKESRRSQIRDARLNIISLSSHGKEKNKAFSNGKTKVAANHQRKKKKKKQRKTNSRIYEKENKIK